VPPDQFRKRLFRAVLGEFSQQLLIGGSVHSPSSNRRRKNRTENKDPAQLETASHKLEPGRNPPFRRQAASVIASPASNHDRLHPPHLLC
jgi:hypothetical protein